MKPFKFFVPTFFLISSVFTHSLHAEDLIGYHDIRPFTLPGHILDGGEKLYRVLESGTLDEESEPLVARILADCLVMADPSKKDRIEFALISYKHLPSVFEMLWNRRHSLRTEYRETFMSHARALFKDLTSETDIEMVSNLLERSSGKAGRRPLKNALRKTLIKESVFGALEVLKHSQIMGRALESEASVIIDRALDDVTLVAEEFWAIFEHREYFPVSPYQIKKQLFLALRAEPDVDCFLADLDYVTQYAPEFLNDDEAIGLINQKLETTESSINKALLWNGRLTFEKHSSLETSESSSQVQSYLAKLSDQEIVDYANVFFHGKYRIFLIERLKSCTPSLTQRAILFHLGVDQETIAALWYDQGIRGDLCAASHYLFNSNIHDYSKQESLALSLMANRNPWNHRLLGARFFLKHSDLRAWSVFEITE